MHVPEGTCEGTFEKFRRIHGSSTIPFFNITLDVDLMLRNAYESISLAIEVKSKINNFAADHGFLISDGGRRKSDI